MCGIAGSVGRQATERHVVQAMCDVVAHRGPDASGTRQWGEGRVWLGHRRLSIIDLSPSGNQPMVDAAGDLEITFNGEIYNFGELRAQLSTQGVAFRTGTDTEVVLAAYRAWGEACLERLTGMFAFAIFDASRRSLFLARDRVGEKPLYYSHRDGRLRFASELKSLMADPAMPRELDVEALHLYLAYGYVPGDHCILRGVRKLPAGCAALYDIGADTLRLWRYWTLPEPFRGPGAEPEPLVDELDALLSASVERQMVADVPVGVLLSGGVDSSVITAFAARLSSKPVKTFTVTFPGQGSFDEAAHAKIVARHFATEHLELPVEPATLDLMPLLARQFDEPMADSSMIPTYLVSKLVREHCTVALGGDGGDELFGGYTHYNWILRQHQIRRFVPRPGRALVGAAAARLPVGVRGRSHLLAFAEDVRTSVAHVNLYFDAETRDALLPERLQNAAISPEGYKAELCRYGVTPLQQATAVDFLMYLPDDILVKVDRASMLTSLEVRAPLLDHRVVEFAFGRVPDAFRATASERKVLLRRLARRLLPETLDLRRKQGLSIPLARWFRGEWGTFMEDLLLSSEQRLFDHGVVREMIVNQRRGLSNTHRLFALMMFELWRREYRVSL